MYGEILGDIIDQPYEFNNHKSKDFPLFSKSQHSLKYNGKRTLIKKHPSTIKKRHI